MLFREIIDQETGEVLIFDPHGRLTHYTSLSEVPEREEEYE